MGLEKFALETFEQMERVVEQEQISRTLLLQLKEICKQFDEFVYKSPWTDKVETILKNGNKLTVGKAGAKTIENPSGDMLVYRKCMGYGESLADGTPTLRFSVRRPSGTTELRVKPNLDGTFSPVKQAQTSKTLLKRLQEICKQFDEFVYKSPWTDKVETILKNGNKLTVGKAGAKAIENPSGDMLVYRKCMGYGESLADGTPTLRFSVRRPSGTTEFRVKPNLDGTFSPVRL